MKPLYRLTESGDYWLETFARFDTHYMRMKQATGDLALLFKRCANSLIVLSRIFVDDVLQASSEKNRLELTKMLYERCELKIPDTKKHCIH